MKRNAWVIFAILSLSIITFVSCDSNIAKTYPSWFDEYSGDTLIDLKAAQDSFKCFGNTIGDKVIIYGSPVDIDYYEDLTGKYLRTTFGTRDNSDLIDSRDIQPFKDALLASGYVHDVAASSSDTNFYNKGNVRIQIYVIAMSGGDPHFEFWVDKTY